MKTTAMGKSKLKQSILFAMVGPFIVFLVSPLAFYLGNHAEYTATLTDALPLLLAITAILAGFLCALLISVHRWPTIHGAFAGILVGLALSAWVQSQIFAWDFGLLDGRGVDWNRWRLHANAEWAVWFTVVSIAVAWAIRSRKTFITVAQGVILLGALTVVSSWYGSGYEPKQRVGVVKGTNLSENTIFSFHPLNNTILIVLDAFQSDVFHEITQRYPEEVAFLQGFTFFPNAMGGYPTTYASIPLILTGHFYKNETPIQSWITDHNADYNIANSFTTQGYGAYLAFSVGQTLYGVKAPTILLERISDDGWYGINKLGLLVLDGGLFRVLPTQIKPGFYDEGNWFFSRLAQDDTMPPGKHGDDLRFLRAFEKFAKIRSDNVGEFRFYHYFAAHPPRQINAHFAYELNMPKNRRAAYILHARGALTLLRRKLEKLKRLQIYDTAQILVVADHGTSSSFPSDMRDEECVTEEGINRRVLSSARPLFLYKPSRSVAPLTHSDNPVHLADVACFLTKEISNIKCDAYLAPQGEKETKRKYYRYEWTREYHEWTKDYLPPMTEYVVDGDIRDCQAWHRTDREYAEGAVRQLPKLLSYNLGDRIEFSQAGNSDRYKMRGWSGQESKHCWTEGKNASLRISFNRASDTGGLKLRLDASGIVPQNVDVVVNKKKVAAWQISKRDWHEAFIPEALLGEGKLHIAFVISNPTAPCTTRDSNDCRELGIAVRALVIAAQEVKS